MSNKTQLQTNNTNLDALIARVNSAKDVAASLPESGSSEDLSAELTEQANLIAQQQTLISNLETALDNKAGSSGGGSVETCTVTVNNTIRFGQRAYVSYTNNNCIPCIDEIVEPRATVTLDVCKNTIMIITDNTNVVSASGGYTYYASADNYSIFFITGDAEFIIEEGEPA